MESKYKGYTTLKINKGPVTCSICGVTENMETWFMGKWNEKAKGFELICIPCSNKPEPPKGEDDGKD